MEQELILQQDYLFDKDIQTIYFGGGTPSLLSDFELETLLRRIFTSYEVSPSAEVTLEANPDDLTFEKLAFYKKIGINRLSIGIQSFSDVVLKYLNRAHSSKEAVVCVDMARKAGFRNISIDLIYGIPINDHVGWSDDLKKAISLDPDHISAYCLTIEDKTTFGNWLKRGKMNPIDEEIAATQFEFLISYLKEKGYEQYEISNFCPRGNYSRHNTNYWQQREYLGVGPGAHSFNGSSRQFNISHNAHYISSLERKIIPFEVDKLQLADRVNEIIMTSLRTKWGCNFANILKDFSIDLYHEHKVYIKDLVQNDLAVLQEDNLILTEKGKLFADKISSDLFINQ